MARFIAGLAGVRPRSAGRSQRAPGARSAPGAPVVRDARTCCPGGRWPKASLAVVRDIAALQPVHPLRPRDAQQPGGGGDVAVQQAEKQNAPRALISLGASGFLGSPGTIRDSVLVGWGHLNLPMKALERKVELLQKLLHSIATIWPNSGPHVPSLFVLVPASPQKHRERREHGNAARKPAWMLGLRVPAVRKAVPATNRSGNSKRPARWRAC